MKSNKPSPEMLKRAEVCAKEVNEVLKKHDCDISARVVITDSGQVMVQKSIIANPSEKEIKVITEMPKMSPIKP